MKGAYQLLHVHSSHTADLWFHRLATHGLIEGGFARFVVYGYKWVLLTSESGVAKAWFRDKAP